MRQRPQARHPNSQKLAEPRQSVGGLLLRCAFLLSCSLSQIENQLPGCEFNFIVREHTAKFVDPLDHLLTISMTQ
jgi:hypothetical protein